MNSKLSDVSSSNGDEESKNEHDESSISDKYLNSNYDHSKTVGAD